MKATLLACAAFLVLFVAWRHASPLGIVFYQGVLLALLVSGGQLVLTHRFVAGPWTPVFKDSLISFLLIYGFVFTVPTTVDRAYSVRMILELQKSPEGLTEAQIGHWFATEFQGQGGVQKRLLEQSATGSIRQQQGRYVLTPLGQWLAGAFESMQALFACGPTVR